MRVSRGLMPIFILLAFSLVSIQYGFIFLSSSDVGVQPNVRIFSGEKITPVTRIENRGVRYDVWDVRKETDNALIFTIVCMPTDGTLIEDPEISSRILAVRLTLEMAKVVQWITEQSQSVDQVLSTIESVLGKAISFAEFGGQNKLARELSNLKSLFKEKAEVAFAIANTVATNKKAAETLINKRSDQNADHFLTMLATTGIAQGHRVASIISFVIRALEFMGISTDESINGIYDKTTYGQMPLLEALAQTYGRYETNKMFLQLSGRN